MTNKEKAKLTKAIKTLGIDVVYDLLDDYLTNESFSATYDQHKMLILASFNLWYEYGDYSSDHQAIMSFIETNAFRKQK